MGQKTNPIGLRLGINRGWDSVWFDEKNYADKLHEDIILRNYISNSLNHASIARIEISRTPKRVTITIHTARPGIVIGKKGEDIEKYREHVAGILNISKNTVKLNVHEIRKPELNAQLVSEGIAQQLERRIMYRRAAKRAVTNTMRLGALGVKVNVAGRLNGAEIARSEWYREGRVPLHTFRANIDYGFSEAQTTYGIIGVKVWIYKGEVFSEKSNTNNKVKKDVTTNKNKI